MPEVTLLYAAFAVVALWLLGELLLQRRAPLHWRALALVGFLVLVAGVAQASLPLIAAGVVAFGAGQLLATRAVKHSDGAAYWTLMAPESVPVVGRLFGGEPSAPAAKGRSRRGRPEAEPELEFEAPQPELGPELQAESEAELVEATAVFQADEYAAQSDSVYYAQAEYAQAEQDQQQAAYYAYSAEQQSSYEQSYADPYAQQYPQYQEQQEYAQYQQQYPQYNDAQQQYAAYDQSYQQSYEQQYGQQYASYGSYDGGVGIPEQQQSGYEYEQLQYYAQDPQHHAPQG